MKLLFQIAAGILLALAVLLLPVAAYHAYDIYKTQQRMDAIVEASRRMTELNRQAALRRQEAVRQLKLEQERRKRVEMANWQKHSMAWMDFLEQYKAPQGCESYDSDSEMAYCIDHRSAAFAKWQGKEQRRTLSAHR